jgi:hypothetical protein
VRFEADLLSYNYFDILLGVVLTFISDGHLAVLIFFVQAMWTSLTFVDVS